MTVPVLGKFSLVADASRYAALPGDWVIGVSDVVDSTGAIQAGHYKAVNLAGAGTISAVSNALEGDLALFAFGGDGSRFAVPPAHAEIAADALARVAMWAKRDLGLDLRVGMIGVAEVRAAGLDARVAFWQASDNVRYTMFTGGGLEWAEAQLKSGAIELPPAPSSEEPDLTGLSCQWGPIRPSHGKILSLIVKPAPDASDVRFAEAATAAISLLERNGCLSPVPPEGPAVQWPSTANALQARIARDRRPLWWRRLRVLFATSLIWFIFKSGLPVGKFAPARYRREISANTDFRKFDDALMMTVDCSVQVAESLRDLLQQAADEGVIRYGLHLQDEALMTCVVPSVLNADHMHFIDGAGGGYAVAAKQLHK